MVGRKSCGRLRNSCSLPWPANVILIKAINGPNYQFNNNIIEFLSLNSSPIDIKSKIKSLRRKRRWLAISNLFSLFYLRNALYGKYSERRELPTFWKRLKRFVPDLPSYWNPALNFASQEGSALVLVHEGEDSELCRQAALNLQELIAAYQFSPILISSMPDFSFYIQLGWLIEFLPDSEELRAYSRRKLRYLAIRYPKAIWLPLEAGSVPQEYLKNLLTL